MASTITQAMVIGGRFFSPSFESMTQSVSDGSRSDVFLVRTYVYTYVCLYVCVCMYVRTCVSSALLLC
jgi:hypothetical protein